MWAPSSLSHQQNNEEGASIPIHSWQNLHPFLLSYTHGLPTTICLEISEVSLTLDCVPTHTCQSCWFRLPDLDLYLKWYYPPSSYSPSPFLIFLYNIQHDRVFLLHSCLSFSTWTQPLWGQEYLSVWFSAISSPEPVTKQALKKYLLHEWVKEKIVLKVCCTSWTQACITLFRSFCSNGFWCCGWRPSLAPGCLCKSSVEPHL